MSDELSPQQYEDISREDDVPFSDITKKNNRFLFVFGTVLLFTIIILSLVIRIPQEVTLAFELKGGSKEHIYQYPQAVYISKRYAQTGDSLQKGDPLIAITSPFIAELIYKIKRAESEQDFYREKLSEQNRQDLAVLQTQAENTEREIGSLEKEISATQQAQKIEVKALKEQVSTAEKQWKRNQKLNKEKVVSEQEAETSYSEYRRAEQLLISARERYTLRINTLQSQKIQLLSRVEQVKSQLISLSGRQGLEFQQILKENFQAQELLKLHFGEYEIAGNAVKLLAKEKGRLTQISQKEGQLQAGEILMRHKIGSEPYTAYALAEPRDMGKLELGQQAILKVDGLPYVYYGTMQGEIQGLSTSPDAKGLYPLVIKVTDQRKLKGRLTKGMLGTVNLIIHEKPVLFFFFEKIAEDLSI